MEKILNKKEKFDLMVNKLTEFLNNADIKYFICTSFFDDEETEEKEANGTIENVKLNTLHHKAFTNKFLNEDLDSCLSEYKKLSISIIENSKTIEEKNKENKNVEMK